MPNDNHPIFVMCLHDTGVALINELKKHNIWVVGFDHQQKTVGLNLLTSETHLCPSPVKFGEELLDFLIKKAQQYPNKTILYATSDVYVQFIAEYEHQLRLHFLFNMPKKEVFDLLFFKNSQSDYVKKCGGIVPRKINLSAKQALSDLPEDLEYPLLLKPIQLHIWAACPYYKNDKIININNYAELQKYDDLFKEYQIDAVIQEMISGPITNNYEVSHYVTQSGVIYGPFIMRKLREYPDFGTGTAGISVQNNDLQQLANQIVVATGVRGFINSEFKWDPIKKQFFFIECNLRVWLQLDLASQCGLDLTRICYLDLTNQLIELTNNYQIGLVWIDPIPDFCSYLNSWPNQKNTLKDWLKTWETQSVGGFFH